MKQELLTDMRALAEPELYREMYLDYLTGVLNRRAFDKDRRPFVAVIDLDSLKYINDTFGHRAGDRQLCTLAAVLADTFGGESVYRLSGDEFAVKTDSPTDLRRALVRLREYFPGFSFGMGSDVVRADLQLRGDKARREHAGTRAARGEHPPWIEDMVAGYVCKITKNTKGEAQQ